MKSLKTIFKRYVLPICAILLVWYLTRYLPAQQAAPQSDAAAPAQSASASLSDSEAQSERETPGDSEAFSESEAFSDSEAFSEGEALDEAGSYTSPEDVALYLHTYGKLPQNFITKKQAQALGWDSKAGNLDEVAPGKSIGGDHFGNYEGGLPEADGRVWRECDVNYDGGYRSGERILYSNDGLIYYTDDHYNTFTQLYGGDA